MTDRPTLFSGAMVRALLDGTKTQTRRVLKPQPEVVDQASEHLESDELSGWVNVEMSDGRFLRWRPPYAVGDRLYVREAFRVQHGGAIRDATGAQEDYLEPAVFYMASGGRGPWTPGIHMPRKLSRLTLSVTDVRLQRLQEISEADALAEGIPQDSPDPIAAYFFLWDEINGTGASAKNPWIVAVSFTVERRNIDGAPT